MAAIKATKKVTPAEIEKGVLLALLANNLMLITQSTLKNNLQKTKMKNGASLSRRLVLLIDPIFRKQDKS